MKLKLLDYNDGTKEFIAFGDDEEFKCKCGKQVTEGFYCKSFEKEKILCKECNDEYDMKRCQHKHGEHQHIKFKRKKENADS